MRTLLYTPGDRGDRIAKALRDHAADIVCADLEDAVAPEAKARARQATAEALSEGQGSRSLRAVRIQPWPSQAAQEDLAQVLPSRPDIVVVPKVEDPGHVRSLDQRLVGTQCRLILILETAAGVLAARELAGCSRRVAAVCFGAEDLCADIGIPRSPTNQEVAMARQWVVLAATAAGVPAIDMVTADVRDLERTAREAAEARRLGFRGKMCIHPLQAMAIHEAFRPTADEASWARKVAAAADHAGAERGGVVVVDGRMVDVPVIRQARRILQDLD